jgi:hypothetical protein
MVYLRVVAEVGGFHHRESRADCGVSLAVPVEQPKDVSPLVERGHPRQRPRVYVRSARAVARRVNAIIRDGGHPGEAELQSEAMRVE